MILRERKTEQGLLVSVCDQDVLGETFEQGDVSITVSPDFYGTEEADEQTIVNSLARAAVANIVGEEAVALAVEHGFVNKANVLEIDSTVHAQLLQVR